MKSRAIRAGVKYLVTHPRGRVTHLVVRFALRRVAKKVGGAPGVEAIPAVRGSRLSTVAAVAGVAGVIVVVVRRSKDDAAGPTSTTVIVPAAPFSAVPSEPAPPLPDTGDALLDTTPTAPPALDAVATEVGDGDDALAARVESELFEGAPVLGVDVAASSGVITLTGEVADEAAESRLVADAEGIDGVKAVQSDLRTAADEADPTTS